MTNYNDFFYNFCLLFPSILSFLKETRNFEDISCGVNKGFSISNFVVGFMRSILFSILSSLVPITFRYVFE